MGSFDGPHRRCDPLTDAWVLVSPDRSARAWRGATDGGPPERRPANDPCCYLCPGNEWAGGRRNPGYDGTFVFDNDFSSLRPDTSDDVWSASPLLHAEGQPGVCRVLCFHPRHDLTLARMRATQIRAVVDVWVDQTDELSRRYACVRLFENSGEQMGASNPHPHGQLVRYDNLFRVPFPYSMGWHGAPGAGGDDGHWQLRAHFYPPLLRSATVRKFMVGFEMLGEAQRDVTAEQAAARLHDLPAEHHLAGDPS